MEKNKIIKITFFCLIVFTIGFCNAQSVNAASLFLSPSSGNFLVGSTFDLSIILDTKDVSVNTIETELFFPADKIQLASPSVGKSIIQIWPTAPVFSNKEGRIYFAGGIPSPGINISEGIVLTLTFRVITLGSAEIKFGDKTSILANDGSGTNILTQKPSAFLKFSFPPPQGPAISSPTHQNQENWYRDNNPTFIWSKSDLSQAYSFEINHDPAGYPDTIADSNDATITYNNLENGNWYFHLREKANGVWGGVSHFSVKIDNQLPASFNINVSPSKRTTNKDPIFRFFTTDTLSGFDHFEMKIVPLSFDNNADGALFFETSSPYQAINLAPGRYQVIVKAFDKAKNVIDQSVTVTIVGAFSGFLSPEGIDLYFIFLPWLWVILITGVILLLVILIIWRVWLKNHSHIKHVIKEDSKNILKIFSKK